MLDLRVRVSFNRMYGMTDSSESDAVLRSPFVEGEGSVCASLLIPALLPSSDARYSADSTSMESAG